jgi:hypothetical protein
MDSEGTSGVLQWASFPADVDGPADWQRITSGIVQVGIYILTTYGLFTIS